MKFKRKPQKRDWIHLACIGLFVGLVAFLAVQYTKAFGSVQGGDIIVMAERFKDIITAYGNAGIIVVSVLHALHVVVSFIPASIIQFGGAMIYGLPVGMLTGIIGVAIGSAVSFYASRLLGQRVVTLFVSEKNIERLESVLSKDMSTLLLLFLFTIPFPKDFIAYFMGLTHIKAPKFFFISFIGRLPGMFVASYLGSHIYDRNYVLLAVVSAVTVLSFVVVFIFKNRIIARLTRRSAE